MVVIEDQLLGAEDDAAKDTALAVDMFGRRVNHAVSTECERALVQRGGEHVVDHQLGASIVCNVRNGGDVDHFQGRVCRRFQKEDLGVFLDRFFHALRSVPLTSVDVTPKRGSHSSMTQRQEPNSALAATT